MLRRPAIVGVEERDDLAARERDLEGKARLTKGGPATTVAPGALDMSMRRFFTLAVVFLAIGTLAVPVRADDLQALVASGTLKIKGDSAGNDFTVDAVLLPSNELRLTPGGTTTINGAGGAQVFAGITGSVDVSLGAGENTLAIDTISIAGGLRIKSGSGADHVTITGSSFGDDLQVALGAGGNTLSLDLGTLGGKLNVKTGAGGTP